MLKISDVGGQDFSVTLSIKKNTYTSELISYVDRVWEFELKERKNALFNGKIFSVDYAEGNKIVGHISEYKFFFAQQKKPELYHELKIMPLAISGILECSDGLVFGKRGKQLVQERGIWELVPSGGIDCNNCVAGQSIDYIAQLLTELEEETGLTKQSIQSISPLAVIKNTNSHVIDIGIYLKTILNASMVMRKFDSHQNREYEELHVVNFLEVEKFYEIMPVIDISKKLVQIIRRLRGIN